MLVHRAGIHRQLQELLMELLLEGQFTSLLIQSVQHSNTHSSEVLPGSKLPSLHYQLREEEANTEYELDDGTTGTGREVLLQGGDP